MSIVKVQIWQWIGSVHKLNHIFKHYEGIANAFVWPLQLVPSAISEYHRYRYTCGFLVGLATGVGMGSQIETHAKSLPMAQVCGCGVATPSKKGMPHHITLTTTTGQGQQQLHTTMYSAQRVPMPHTTNQQQPMVYNEFQQQQHNDNLHNNNAQPHCDDKCGWQCTTT